MQTDLKEWQRVVLPYRMLIKTLTKYLQAPGVKSITYNANYWRWEFKAEELKILQPTTAYGVVLLCPKGQVIGEGNFEWSRPAIRSDSLYVACSLGAPPKASLEEVVDSHKKQWRKS
jgi:hypothetical protein